MEPHIRTIRAADGLELHVHTWSPASPPRAALLLAHGMGEHAGRYGRLAEALVAAGFTVWAPDQRGHGRTAAASDTLGHFGDHDGWNAAVGDLRTLLGHLRAAAPDVPVTLMGHSMGAFLVQQFLCESGAEVDAAVLSGSSLRAGPPAGLARIAARVERRRSGPRAPSALLERTFASFAKPFQPTRTHFDWLSRDPEEVDRYVADPHCGFVVSTQSFCDMADALSRAGRPAAVARIPRSLPLYVFSGEDDPVHNRLRGIENLLRSYRSAGLERVESRVYAGGRHEMLNESNRDEVTADLLAWLGRSF